jgi:site-specific recombinase XerD
MGRRKSFLELEDDFKHYLLEVRGLSERTIRKHIGAFRYFGNFLKDKRVSAPRRVRLNLVYEFLEERAPGCSRHYILTLRNSLRQVLRFLYFTGKLPRDLSKQMIIPKIWKLADIPKSFTESETACMIENLRYETPYDHRERAVVLLLICYGLRLRELTRMMLDNIDWQKKTITIPERKNSVPLVLPILPPVEKALQDYLTHFRPEGLQTRRLWVTIHRKSRAPLEESGIKQMVDKFLRRCGIDGCVTKFRHTLATYLINNGVSMAAIGQILGHQQMQSTRIYAKVHWEALREVAQNYSLDL